MTASMTAEMSAGQWGQVTTVALLASLGWYLLSTLAGWLRVALHRRRMRAEMSAWSRSQMEWWETIDWTSPPPHAETPAERTERSDGGW